MEPNERLNRIASERIAVSPEEAAKLIGVGRTTIFAELRSGALRSVKLGARRLITIAALLDWIAKLEKRTEGPADVR